MKKHTSHTLSAENILLTPENKMFAARKFRGSGGKECDAGVAQLVERQLPKLNVASSNLVAR
jgi:hypothetical protein